MKTYLISYDTKSGYENSYPKIAEVVQSFGLWWRYLSGFWLIRTTFDAQQIFEKIEPYLDNNINLFIVDIGSDSQGWLPPDAWKWLEENK